MRNLKMENDIINDMVSRLMEKSSDFRKKAKRKQIDNNFGILTRIREGRYQIPFQRKTEFDDCRSFVNYTDLIPTQKKAIKNISSVVVSKDTSSFDYIFPSNEDDNELVYLVSRNNVTYLVNNEGFGYSRYIIELRNY